MQVIYSALCLPGLWSQPTFTEHIQSLLITGFKLLPGPPGIKGLIAGYIGRNPNLSKLHPYRICNFRTLSSGSDSNADDQYSELKWFIVRDLTNWANKNHSSMFSKQMRWIFSVFTLFPFQSPSQAGTAGLQCVSVARWDRGKCHGILSQGYTLHGPQQVNKNMHWNPDEKFVLKHSEIILWISARIC